MVKSTFSAIFLCLKLYLCIRNHKQKDIKCKGDMYIWSINFDIVGEFTEALKYKFLWDIRKRHETYKIQIPVPKF